MNENIKESAIILPPDTSALGGLWRDWLRHLPGQVRGEVPLSVGLKQESTRLLVVFGGSELERLLEDSSLRQNLSGKIIYDLSCSSRPRAELAMTAGVSGYLGYGGTAWVFLGGNNESVYRKSYLSGLHALAKGKTMGDAREAINRAWIHMAQNRTARYLDRICAFNHAQDLYLLGDSAVQLVSSPIFWTSVPVDGVVEEPRVEIVDVSSDFIAWVQEDPQRVHFLSPDKFEELIADRLEAMNFCVEQIGTTFRSDGGIDLIAYPEVSPVPFLLAIQIKHSRSGRPVGSTTVRDFQGALINLPIDVGMIVTNTRFTPHARWFAERRSRIIRLRDFEDLRQWLQGQFSSDSLLEELPEELELLPGLTVRIPRPLR